MLGGIHSNFCWEELLKKEGSIVDYIIRGEGDIATTELLNCVFSGKKVDIQVSHMHGMEDHMHERETFDLRPGCSAIGMEPCGMERLFIQDKEKLPPLQLSVLQGVARRNALSAPRGSSGKRNGEREAPKTSFQNLNT